MTDTEVGILELKAHLSKYLRRVREGYSVLITDRGKPIGRAVPAEQPLADRLRVMVDTGALLWSGKPLVLAEPVAKFSGDRTETGSEEVKALLKEADIVGTALISRAELVAAFATPVRRRADFATVARGFSRRAK